MQNNVTLGTYTNIIKAQFLPSIFMKNSTFIQVKSLDLGDSTPKMIGIPSIILTDQLEYIMQNIYIEDSQVGFIEVSDLVSSKPLSSKIVISNFTYANSYLDFPNDLISFARIETTNDLQIYLSDISMKNITFERTGNLMNLEHQTNTILTLNNAAFENNVRAQILIRSSNLRNTDLKTKVNMISVNATSISGNSKSLLHIEEGGKLYIYNSSFTSIDNTERGAVLNAGYQNSYVEVHNSTFENNLSIYGGVANVQDESVIKFFDSNFTNNFAIESGIIQVSSNGRFEYIRWNIVNNYAYTLPVSEVFLTSNPSLLSNSFIQGNIVLSRDHILEELDSWSKLWSMSDIFKQYLSDNLSLLGTTVLKHSIQWISGYLKVSNNTYITNQPYFITSYSSKISIENSTIYEINSDGNILTLIDTEVTISKIEAYDLHTSNLANFIWLTFDSVASINNINYANSTIKFVETLSSQLQITNLTSKNISLTQYLIDSTDCSGVTLRNIMIYNINTTKGYLIYATRSSIDLIMNTTIYDINVAVLHILKSNVTTINNLYIHDVVDGVHFQQSSIRMFENSRIYRSGSANILQGGALLIENSNSIMQNISFMSNTAQSGGAVNIDCDTYDICQNIISNSTFSNNTAAEQGGAIFYNYRRPEMPDIKFSNNTAPYGSNIGSYPVRIVNSLMMDEPIVLTNVVSGLTYNETLRLLLVDYDGQTMNLVSNSQIKIVPVTSEASLLGVDYSVLVNGQASFDSLHFVYGPGQNNIQFLAMSELIDSEKVSYLSLPTNNSIDVSFRYCQPGEIVRNNQTCFEWSAGTYSFVWELNWM